MKSIELFCASQASTATCSSTVRHRPPPTDPQNRRLGGHRSILSQIPIPCSSQSPIHPKSYYYQKSRKSTSSVSSSFSSSSTKGSTEVRRKSSADVLDLRSPPGSCRYLLSDAPFIDLLAESDDVSALVPSKNVKIHLSRSSSARSSDSSSVFKSSSTRSTPSEQVVELRVSIHCKGCEGKVRKHISRMEGVKSFTIDFVTKKVTVIGDVTPLGVLNSISRVKNAQFWSSSTSTSSTSSSSSSSSPMIGFRY